MWRCTYFKDDRRNLSIVRSPSFILSLRAFGINLQPQMGSESDIHFHMSIRFHENCIVRNTRQGGRWGREERGGGLPLSMGQHFQMMIAVYPNCFKVHGHSNDKTDLNFVSRQRRPTNLTSSAPQYIAVFFIVFILVKRNRCNHVTIALHSLLIKQFGS